VASTVLDLNAEELEPQGEATPDGEEDAPEYRLGVLAGCEYSPEPNAKLNDLQKNAFKDLATKASKRDYPARLIEVIESWQSALFYRGFQFLTPLRGGGWQIPGESTGYGPSMQMDLALLPTNIYSAQAQILISTLTRAIPTVRFEPQDGANDAQITAAESAEKFIKVIERNNDLMMVQNDAARYLYTDGRAIYWSRFEKDGQRFGWEEDDRPDDVVPENEPAELPAESGQGGIPGMAPEGEDGPEVETPAVSAAGAPPEGSPAEEQAETPEQEAAEQPTKQPRTPRGQEVRTAHGKLEFKLIPMSANDLQGCDAVQYETEVDVSRAKGMFPWVADDIKGGSMGQSEGEIARLARQNVKLGMQSTYITSDSVADDVTIQRTWFRPSYFTHIADKEVRTSVISLFPDGALVVYAGETFCYARNESMEASLALIQAFSGDGQNRNALGTSMMPIQKRVNNWLDLLNDSFIRTVPKKWMDSKAFDVNALKKQTNIPGDIGSFKRQPGVQVSELCWVEPQVTVSPTLAMFVKEYIGPISELMSGAYPALAGSSDLGGNDTKGGIEIQRNQALGRLGPTWHSIQNAEATSMRQLVMWGAKCRDKSINERIPGGRPVELEVNDLRANILCFAETDESFPENHADKKAQLIEVFEDSAKTPQLQEVLYNASNLEFLQSVYGLSDLYIPQVASRNKQLGEFEILLKSAPVPNPKVQQANSVVQQLKVMGADPQKLQLLEQQIAQMPPEICSIQIDSQVEDSETEAATCWQWLTSPEGRKSKRLNAQGYNNVRLHFLDHTQDAMQKKAAAGPDKAKPPAESINLKDLPTSGAIQLAKKGGIDLTPADFAEQEAKEAALKTAKSEPAPALAPAHPAAPPG
jgi:hypothetical protein